MPTSLRARLLLLVLLALLPALGLIVFSAYEQRRAAIGAAQRSALLLAQSVAHEQRRTLVSTRDLLHALAQLREVRDRDSVACRELFTKLLAEHPVYLNLGVIGPDGRLLCSALYAAHDVSLADRAYFRRALETRDFAVGDYQIGRVTGRPSINAGYPVVGPRGRVEAVVFAALDLDWLSGLALEAGLPDGSSFTMVDRDGTILVRHPEPERWAGKSLPEAPSIAVVRAVGVGVAEAAGVDGVPRLLGFNPLLGGGQAGDLFVSIGVPRRAAVAEADRLLLRNLLGLGVVGVVTFVAAWFGSNAFVLRRVDALVAAANQLARGDLSARVGGSYTGELGHLARAFDQMAEAIDTQQTRLREAAASLRESNETLQALIHASPLAIVAVDREGNVRSWNRAAERLFGWTEVEVLGRPNPLVPPGRQDEHLRHRARAWGGEVLTGIETQRQTKGGSLIDVSLSSAPVYGVNASVESVLAMYADIRERRRAEQEVERQREALAQGEKMAALGRLAAGVAHELRNPLSVIDGNIQLLRMKTSGGAPLDAGELSQRLERLEHAAHRMKSIVAGLSSYSKPTKAEPTLLKVHELLTDVVELVAYQARKAEVVTEVDASGDLPPVLGDRSEMTQILLNLATNAIEAMAPTTTGRLILRARATPGDDGPAQVVIEVADTGPGIPAPALQKIWQAFYTTKAEGTGLGLSIVRGLVEKQPGASISVESAEGAGTTFSLTMPAAPR